MTVVTYPLDAPPAANQRGGDCRARDLHQARNVHGPHRFAATTHCRISNGIIRATLGADGAAPTLTLEAYRGPRITGDTFTITYHPTYGGIMSDDGWEPMGVATIDSPSLFAPMTAVRVAYIDPERLTLRLLDALLGHVFVTLRRGERMLRIQHGDRRSNVTIARRVSLTDSPSPVGTLAAPGRLQEAATTPGGFVRLVAALDPTTGDAGAFSLTTGAVTKARFGVGAGTSSTRDTAADMHKQLRDASRAQVMWREDEDDED